MGALSRAWTGARDAFATSCWCTCLLRVFASDIATWSHSAWDGEQIGRRPMSARSDNSTFDARPSRKEDCHDTEETAGSGKKVAT